VVQSTRFELVINLKTAKAMDSENQWRESKTLSAAEAASASARGHHRERVVKQVSAIRDAYCSSHIFARRVQVLSSRMPSNSYFTAAAMHPVAAHDVVAFVPSPERRDHGLEHADQPHSPATEADRWLAPAGDRRCGRRRLFLALLRARLREGEAAPVRPSKAAAEGWNRFSHA